MSEDCITNNPDRETPDEKNHRRLAFSLGVQARREGARMDTNPYRETNKLHYHWRKGWEGGL